MEIREEAAADRAAIRRLLEEAFGGDEEARLVDALRRDGDVFLSLVAVVEARVVGHILLSVLKAPFPAVALAPLAVAADARSSGVGAALIGRVIDYAQEGGARAIFVLGDPGYYARFGFRADLAANFSSVYEGPYLLALPLGGPLPTREGRVDYAAAFAALSNSSS